MNEEPSNEEPRPLSPEETRRVVELAMGLARAGDTAELAAFLDHGLPADAQDGEGNSLLMLAAYHGHAETVRMLVEQGADVDLRNHRDQTPVAGAVFKGEDAVVRVLVEAGADLDAGTPSARAAAEMFGRSLD
ncbi:MAG TPA: ankyrin repeat domain-containing protein [Marmoricola sp.]|nr:ankyrin repeat domain-containing protein [Marmoricola sp.]